MELSQWLQAILFRARGGLRSGEEHQGATISPALSLHPPRACKGLVECARRELPSWPFSFAPSVLRHTCISSKFEYDLKELYTAGYLADIHRCWIVLNCVGVMNEFSLKCLNGVQSVVRQTAHNLYSTTCVRCWVRKTGPRSNSDDFFISELWRLLDANNSTTDFSPHPLARTQESKPG